MERIPFVTTMLLEECAKMFNMEKRTDARMVKTFEDEWGTFATYPFSERRKEARFAKQTQMGRKERSVGLLQECFRPQETDMP